MAGAGQSSKAAIIFTSTAIGVGNDLISMVVRVGLGFPGPAKYSAYTRLYVGKSSFMSVRKTSTSTTFCQCAPASAITVLALSKQERHCASMSRGSTPGIVVVPRCRGPIPETNSRFPTRLAWG